MPVLRLAVLVLSLLLLGPGGAAAEEGSDEATVLVLGTYHFHNPGLDYVQGEVADILSARKQTEVAAVVEALARFRPTKIAIERVPGRQAHTDSAYRAFRAGERALTANEIEQLGFRLADRLGHERVHAIDVRGSMDIPRLLNWAREHDPAFVAFFDGTIGRFQAWMDSLQRERTLAEILRAMNDPEELRFAHALYVRMAQVGTAAEPLGARLIAGWYERNLGIFANLARLAEPGDRVLVLYGQGHAPILRRLVTDAPGLRLADPLEVLP